MLSVKAVAAEAAAHRAAVAEVQAVPNGVEAAVHRAVAGARRDKMCLADGSARMAVHESE